MKKRRPVGLMIAFTLVLVLVLALTFALVSLVQDPPAPVSTEPAQEYPLPGTSNVQLSGCNSAGECNNLCWDGEAFVTCEGS